MWTKHDKLQIYSTDIEDVRSNTYLGSIVTCSTKGDTDEDIADRKRKAEQALKCHSACLEKPCTSTKIRMFNTTGKSTLYASETWRETAISNSKIQTFINRCLRNILGIWWPEKISNTISGIGPINNPYNFKSDEGGHTLRNNDNNVIKQAPDWNPHGHRKKGRPKNTWRRRLEQEWKKIGKTSREAN